MAEIVDQKTSLLDSAIGPVAVTTTTYEKFNIDDFVVSTVQGKAEYIRTLNKAATVNPEDAKGRPPVTVGGHTLGGHDDAV